MKYRLLGPVNVLGESGWTAVRAARQRAVLSILLLEAGRVVPMDRLVDELWPQGPPTSAVNTVQAYIMRVRRLLDDPAAHRLVRRAPGYQLLADPDDLDVSVFDRLVRMGQSHLHGQRWQVAAECLTDALALWRGPAMVDVPAIATVTTAAARLDRRRLAAVELRVGAELMLGREARLLTELERLVAEHPLQERLRTLLMLALYRCGRRIDALTTYREGRQVLVRELGLEPAGHLQALERAILQDDLHRCERTVLAGLVGPVEPPAAPDRPPPASVPAPVDRRPPMLLPPDVGDFTGRRRELSELLGLLSGQHDRSCMPVAAIAGPAGVGKTTLAVHAAHHLRSAYPDGQLFADLKGWADRPVQADSVLRRFFAALGVPPAVIPGELGEQAQLFRDLVGGRRILVVLDNVADERQIQPLMPASPTCAVLLTGRTVLAGTAAQTIRPDRFEPASTAALLQRICGFARTAAEPEAVAAIGRHCDELPLAVRIVGARLAARPHWPLSRMVHLLADPRRRLDELAISGLSVRDGLEQGYAALPADARQALRALGVLDVERFSAPMLAAALAVGLDDAERWLDELIDNQLVVFAGSASRPMCYRITALVRIFGQERAAAEDPPEQFAPARQRTRSIRLLPSATEAVA